MEVIQEIMLAISPGKDNKEMNGKKSEKWSKTGKENSLFNRSDCCFYVSSWENEQET